MHVEICLICAKSEELREVIKVLDSDGDFRKIKRGNLKDIKGAHLTDQVYEIAGSQMKLIAATCSGMGHMKAAVRTTQIIARHQPSILIFLGTAAALRPEKVQIGDVIIPRKSIFRVYEKISQKGQRDHDSRARNGAFKEYFFEDNALISDLSTVECSPQAQGLVASLKLNEVYLSRGEGEEINVGGKSINLRNPKIFDDIDIFSCGMVVDSVSYREFLTEIADENMRKADAIDMESYGFFSAIEEIRRIGVGSVCEGIMIRGISDYAGRKQQTEELPAEWKLAASTNAAVVAAHVLKSL